MATEFTITVNAQDVSPGTLYTGGGTDDITVKWTAGANVTGFTITNLDSTFSASGSGGEVTSFNCNQSPDGQSHQYQIYIVSSSPSAGSGSLTTNPRVTNTSRP